MGLIINPYYSVLLIFPLKNQYLSNQILVESLILAQDERWRRVLGMQVERSVPFSFCYELNSNFQNPKFETITELPNIKSPNIF